jgi:taurine dioxygenase
MNYSRIKVKPISGAMGAEVFDVDLSRDLDEATWGEINDAFHSHIVLIFRDQDLTDQQQFDFSQGFGKIIPHPYVTGLPDHPEIFQIIREPGESYSWDTAFTNMYLAYETLSEGMKALLDGLEAVNESGDPEKYSDRYQSMHELNKNAALSATHPVVRVHPVTGRKALYVSLAFTKRFKGMTDKESAPLLQFLYEHATQTHFGCRLRWEKGSLALWDNRVSLHHAVADYFGEVAKHRRVMQRATIEGEIPLPAFKAVKSAA